MSATDTPLVQEHAGYYTSGEGRGERLTAMYADFDFNQMQERIENRALCHAAQRMTEGTVEAFITGNNRIYLLVMSEKIHCQLQLLCNYQHIHCIFFIFFLSIS